jgi:hypothetical protein
MKVSLKCNFLFFVFSGRLYPRAVVPASTALITHDEAAAVPFQWLYSLAGPFFNNNNFPDITDNSLSASFPESSTQFEVETTRPFLLERR